jgi:hypothetical protein
MAELDDFDGIRRAFKDGTIHSAKNDALQTAVATLANTMILNDHVKHEAIIMNDAIHGILLRRLLDGQEERNKKAQFWFMVLAIAGVLAAVAQVVVALIQRQ